MTRQAKVTKEMIDQAAFKLVKEQGFSAVTARNVAKEVGCSTQPIYKIYANLDQMKEAVGEMAIRYMHDKVYGYSRTSDPFLNAGLGYVNFAAGEKLLYRELVIDNRLRQVFSDAGHEEELFGRMEKELEDTGLSREKKEQILLDILIYSNGLASLVYSGQLTFSEEQIADMLIRFVEQIAGVEYRTDIEGL